MEEQKNEGIAAADQTGNAEIAQELERVRGRNKTLKVVTLLLSGFFVLILVAVAFVYHKIIGVRDMLNSSIESGRESPFAPQYPSLPSPLPGAGGIPGSTQTAGSSLMMMTGLDPAGADVQGIPGMDMQKTLQLLSKYSRRPIVRDFMAELGEDPAFQKIMADAGKNPGAITDYMRNNKSMQMKMMKFAMRPDFLPFMIEVTKDPQLAPYMKGLPGGMNAAQVLQNMPAQQAQQAAPVVSVPGPQDAAGGDGGSVDPAAVGQQGGSAPIKKKAPPPMAE